MRHRRKTQNLSRFSSYFQATLRSLVQAVIKNQRIVTTRVRARLTQPRVDRLITLGKQVDSVAARRRAFEVLNDHHLVHRLFSDIAPMFADRSGGYTRVIPYKRRRGDNAELVVLELSVQKEQAHSRPLTQEEAAPEASRAEKPKAEKPKQKAPHTSDAAVIDAKSKIHKTPVKKGFGIGKIFKKDKDSQK